MKDFLKSTFILAAGITLSCAPYLARSQSILQLTGPANLGGGAPTYEFRNGFEGVGTEGGIWTNWQVGTTPANYDDQTNSPPEGLESLKLTGGGTSPQVHRIMSARDNFYCSFELYIGAWSNFANVCSIRSGTGAGTEVLGIDTRTGSTLRMTSGGQTRDSSGWNTGTWYRVRLEYEKAQGTNDQIARYYRDNVLMSTEITTGTNTAQATILRLTANGSHVNQFDDVVIDTSPITSDPP